MPVWAGRWRRSGARRRRFWQLVSGTKQVYDAAIVQEAAELFARGNYKMMSADYLNAYPYQLGICLRWKSCCACFRG